MRKRVSSLMLVFVAAAVVGWLGVRLSRPGSAPVAAPIPAAIASVQMYEGPN